MAKNQYPPVTQTTFDEDVEKYGIEIAKDRDLWRQFDDFKAANGGRECFMVNGGTNAVRFEVATHQK